MARFQNIAVRSPRRAIYSGDRTVQSSWYGYEEEGLSRRGISCLVNGTATINRVPIAIEKRGLIKVIEAVTPSRNLREASLEKKDISFER